MGRGGRSALTWVFFTLFFAVCLPAALPVARAEATDATKSESTGSGLQFATAGVLAQFTVTAKDESGVRRTSGGDEWIVELDGTRSLTGSVVDNLDGTYQVSYTATKSGSYEAGVKLAKSGGLSGSYFENVWFFYTPVKVTVDPQINMDWGTGLITPTGANYISVRWVGKVKTQYAETYTFYATTDDGARLWVDSVPLIDRWDSYCNETSATIALKANVFYDIKMEYKQVTGSAFAKLAWASQSTPKEIVPSSQLYYETQAKKSPFSFIVMPNVANGTRSTAAGTGLAVATAGTGAQFTIQANDMYDNERGEGGDIFSVRVYPPGSVEVGAQGRAVHGVVVDNTDSSYSVEYTTYKSGNSTLYAALLVRGGITATYYDNQDFTIPVKYAEGTTNLQKVQFQPITASNNDNSVPTVADFSVRYAGFVAPTMDSTYQFMWFRSRDDGLDRVKVWVDNSLIVDQWSSLESTNPTGTIELRSAYYYDAAVEYRVSGCATGSCDASQKLQWAPSGQTLADVGSTNLYRGYNVMGSPYTVDVQPAGTCAAKSIAVANQAGAGHSLELSTAGLQAEFTITAKDLYGNLRGTGGDNFKVRLTGVDSTSGLVQDLSPAQPGSYRVVYTATKSGTYDVSIVFGASGINQSPFRMVTQPARRHMATSLPSGVGLTLATAGVLSSVTITVKDRHGNWQPDPSVVEAGIQFALTDTSTLQATGVVQDASTPSDLPGFVDTVSYIGPSTNAGHQVATPTDLDNPRLVMRYTATRSGSYSMVLGGSRANDGSVSGSPFALTMFPNVACAATSTATGDSLSLATAGIPGAFTIQARDQYYNLRGSNSGDNFVARVRQFYSAPSSGTHAAPGGVVECGRPGVACQSWQTYNYGSTTVGGRDKPATISDRGDGTYVVSYNATRASTNYVWATFAVAGGLQATYYTYTNTNDDNDFTCNPATSLPAGCARTVQADQTVDFSVTASLTTRMPGAVTNWAARWTGLVRPSLSETYTFHAGGDASGSQKDERIKLWVDNSLIISQWHSLALNTTGATGHIDLMRDHYYEILLEAKAVTADTAATAPFQLRWSSNHHASTVISSSRLFQSHHVSSSPFMLSVLPAITCAGTSRVRRPALTLTTAGILSSFTVQSKDAFDNIRTLAIEDSSALDFAILANASLPPDDTDASRQQPSEANGGAVAYQASTFYIGGGGYQVNYTATRRGNYNVRGQIMQPGGVFGTYFENDDLSDHGTDTLGVATESKPFQRMDPAIDFDWSGGRPVPAPSIAMRKDIGPSYFSARWQGMVKPSFSEVFTFHVMVDDGAKLWINDLLIIDQWYSRCSEVDGTVALMAGTLYPIKLEYKQVVGNATVQLRWASRSQAKSLVPPHSFYSNTTTYNLCNRNQSLSVEPAVVCASTSSADGSGLTGATAGMPAVFTIQSRDEYMNNRKLSDAGIRPGYAGYFCDDWSHSGAVNPLQAQTSTSIYLDLSSASSVDDYYLGRTITITSGAGAGQSRIIADYDGGTTKATVAPPLTVVAESTSTYSITNYGGQFSERCDATRMKAFVEGHPEFHVRVTPVVEGSQAPYHASGIIDRSLMERDQQGSGIARLSSTEYPGGLTATYYDSAGVDADASAFYDPGFASPLFSTWCTTAQPCEETIDFSSVAAAGPWKRTYGEFPEALANVGIEPTGTSPENPLSATYYDHESAGWMQEQVISDKEYGVRWSGFISPTLAGVYTFYAGLHDTAANPDDRVKLWIDNKLVIQQWTSLAASGKAVGTFHFEASYPSAYPISVHYKNPGTATSGGLTLRWDNVATGSTVSGVIHSVATANSYCLDAGTSDLQRGSVCLATISTSSPFTQVLDSPHGTVSDLDDAYVGQVIQYTSSYGGPTTEVHYVQDYHGVKTGTCRRAAGSNASAFLDEDASTTDDFYTGHYIHITSGTGAGEYHLITGYTGCSQSGCDPYSNTLADGNRNLCYCAATTSRKAAFAGSGTATDATSKYRIAMYRVALHVPPATAPKLADATKSAYASFAISTGYTLVTYGSAECAEYTGTAAGGGPITTTEANVDSLGTNVTQTMGVADAQLLFGQISHTSMFVAMTSNRNILVSSVDTSTNTLTYSERTVDVTTTACGASSPCSITPRNTIVLDPSANTVDDFYAQSGSEYYIQVVSGSCVGQWRKIVKSEYWSAQNYVTAAVVVPWSETNTADVLGCAQPDSSSVYYMSKVCAEATITLQTVGPLSSLTVRPGADGEAILETAQSNVGSAANQWNPMAYGQTPTEGDQYPYPYQPYDHSCCKALSGQTFDNYYVNMLIVITSGTGRGQRRFTSDYEGDKLLLTVAPRWIVLPDSTSRYAIFKAKESNPVDTSNASTPLTPSVAGASAALGTAPIVPSTRLFPLRSRYEVTYLPTVKGDYQVHATLAQGSGIDATYYDDMDLSVPVSTRSEDTINFDVADAQRGFGADVPRDLGALALSDRQSFSVRWAGLLQVFDDEASSASASPHVFTFEAGIAETDERVKLWVDNSLIIDRWETYDYLSGTTFTATIGLTNPHYYDLKMEYKQYAGAAAQAVLRWQCSIVGAMCETKSIVPSGNLFKAREISGSPFPPHEVHAAPTCADRSTVRGTPLSLATAGVADTFTIQAHDEYDNERGVGGEEFVVRAVPYDAWDKMEPYAVARGSKDCISCPSTVRGSVEDMGDSSYEATINGTKRGAYKVLTSLAVGGGLSATYYAADASSYLGSRFHRGAQVADSESDWPVPCVLRGDFKEAATSVSSGYTLFNGATDVTDYSIPNGAWRGSSSGVWRGKHQCQNWISGTARSGSCSLNTGYGDAFASCKKVITSEETLSVAHSSGTVGLEAASLGSSADYPSHSLIGTVVALVNTAAGAGQFGTVTAYDAATDLATVGLTEGTTASKYLVYDCGLHPLATTQDQCTAASTSLYPTAWHPATSNIMYLDLAMSDLDKAYEGFNVKITSGSCKGQVREITKYYGRQRLALVGLAWSSSDGTMTQDAYGAPSSYSGCASGPDATSTYFVYRDQFAPGSMDYSEARFGVRWAGFVKPSSTAEYTFQSLLAGQRWAAATVGAGGEDKLERVKLWVDNRVIIDQWTSLASTTPSGTIAFPSASGELFDIQIEYKRIGGSTAYGPSGTTKLAGTPADAVPATQLPPRMTLRWKNQQSGSDAVLSEAHDFHAISSSRLFSSSAVPNSRVLDLQVAGTSPGVSVATGDGLTAATAGSQAFFTVTAKDSFANDRELEEDSFVVSVEGPNAFRVNAFPVPSPSMPGTYQVSYVATQSGSYDISVRRAAAGGLMAEYFNNMWLLGDPAISVVDPEVAYSWGAAAIAPSPPSSSSSSPSPAAAAAATGADYMSVRWSGMFKPELSEDYTFFAGVDAGARLYVDGTLVVDQWDASTASEYSATLAAEAGLMYELKMEYRHVTGDASASLLYSSPSVAKRVIPSSRLFSSPQHVFGSPFKSYVSPSSSCAAASLASGSGLSSATAGHSATFVLQARDEYLNARTRWEDTFVVKASQTDHLGRAKAGVVGVNVVKGRYNVAYLVTRAGAMNVYASLAVAGGVMATYYDSVSATYYSEALGNTYGGYGLPAKSEVSENVYANNVWITEGGGGCACSKGGTSSGTAATGGVCACRRTSLVQDNVFAARWSGLIRPSSAAEYTFHTVQQTGSAAGDSGKQRVKLWLDNVLVIDQWTSLDSATPTATYAFPAANDYYEVSMEYMSLSASATLTGYMANANYLSTAFLAIEQSLLLSAATVVGSSSLAQSAAVAGSPYAVSAMADVTDFASSSVVGDALTVATAGVQSEFTITSSDRHGNLRSEGGDQYLVHVSSVAGSVFEGEVTDAADGTYTVQYTPSVQGTYDVKVYLGSSDKTATLLVEPGAACASTSVPNGSPLTTATAGYAATFTIQAKDAFTNLRTLGSDQYMVRISSGSEIHNNPVSYIGEAPNTNLGRFTVAYRATRSGTFSVDVRMAHSPGLTGSYYRDEAMSNLVVTQTDSTVNNDWGKGSPSNEVGIVDGFSVAWSGYVKPTVTGTYTFYPTVKEADERVKLWVDDQWIVDEWTSLSTTVETVSGTLWLAANALYDVRLQYKDVSGSSSISLSWEGPNPVSKAVIPSTSLFSASAPVAGSPFAAAVYPAATSGTVSTAFGAGLSVATAGVEAAFTIQARDHLGNPKTTSDDTFVVRARHNADYTKRNIVGSVRSLSGNMGQYSVTYTPTWKRNNFSCATPTTSSVGSCEPGASDPLAYHEVGLVDSAYTISDAASIRKQVVGTPSNLRGAKHKFHDLLVSQAVRGGLMATYYTAVVPEGTRTAAAPQLFSGTFRTKIVPAVNHQFATSPTEACLDAIDTSFGARYSGFFSPPTAEEFTFYAGTGANNNERVRVWMDNSLIIDQWTSLAATDPSGKLQFGVTGLYDVKIEYKQEAASANDNGQLDFKYKYSGETTAVTVPSTRLYQSHDLTFKIFDQVGLAATYYAASDYASESDLAAASSATNASKATQESTVDWSGSAASDRPYPGSVDYSSGFSVRWTGFIRPSRVDEYTFYTPLQGGAGSLERVQLWIDNTLVVSQWASLEFLEASGTISFPAAGDYYNLVMDYKVASTQVSRGFALKWQNLGQASVLFGMAAPTPAQQVAKGVVRADSLFQVRTTSVVERDDMIVWDTSYYTSAVPTLENRETGAVSQVWARINGCPAYVDCTTDPTTCVNQRHDRCRGQGTRMNDIVRVDVKPGPVCASTTTVSDDGGLSLSTAGITRTFMLTARDEFDNQRDAVDDSFIARASLVSATAADRPFHSTFAHRAWGDLSAAEKVRYWDQNGKYSGSYIITRSGAYSAQIQTTNVDKTGPNKGLFGTYFSTNNLLGTAVTQEDASVNFNWGRGNPTTSSAIVANQFSARWTGFVRTNFTEVYTFYTNCDYGVRLYVDDLALVSQWGAPGKEYSATFSAKGTVLYDITLEYQTTTGLSFCELWFSSPSTAKQVVPQDDLFVKAQTISSGDKSIDVVASVVSGTVSAVDGAGLSIATAGIPASFTVVSRDMYGNTRDQCNDILFARMVPDGAPCGLVGPGSFDYDWKNGAGNAFSCSKRGKMALLTTDTSTMMTEVAGGTDDNHGAIGGSPLVAQTFGKPAPLDTDGTSCTRLSNTGNLHPFAYIQTRAGSHTLLVSEIPGGRATSYLAAVGTGLMATYYETSSFATPRNARDCRLVQGSSPQVYDTSSCDTGTAAVGTTGLVTPASLIDDGIFSVRWAGLVRMPATFATLTFQAKIGKAGVEDERVKLWVDNSLLIDQWTSLAATDISAVVDANYHPTASSLYDIKVEYKNVVGGASDDSNLDIKWVTTTATLNQTIPSASLYPHHAISGQPLRVRVNPNVAFHRECEVYGNGLTLATAGVQATFAIQSKDAYNNKRGTGGDLFVVRAFSDGCQVYSNAVSEPKQHTCQAYGPSIPTCGQATDTVCPASTNPPPEMNDGGDDDGDWSAGQVSKKAGNSLASDYAAALCPTCPRIVRADVVDSGDGTYRATFTGTQKGRYTVVTSLVNPGGLAATFYGNENHFVGNQDADWTDAGLSYKVDQTVDWSASAVSTYPVTELVGDSGKNFKVRWVGFVRPSRASQYTFHANLAENSDRVKLWVDNSILIEQWMSLGSANPSGTLGFAKANGYYDIGMLYKCLDNSANQCGYTLQWENTASGVASDDVSKGTIPSTRLFQRYDVPNTGLVASGSPLFQTKDTGSSGLHTTLRVRPAVTCSTQSTALTAGLTLATAGVATSFTIQAKDAYENAREDSNAAFTVDLFGSGGSPIYNGQVAVGTANAGTYVASYTAENAKNYDLFVKFGGENVKGSPFSNTVLPAAQCGSKSTIQGTGLTAASISPSKSAFTIQARDQYGNAKTQALSGAEFVVRVARTSGSGMQGTNGQPPFYGSTAISTSPTVHATFNTATNDGKYAGYYQIPSTPSPTGYTHYLYASYVAAGGVYATYYDTAAATQAIGSPIDMDSLGTTALTRSITTDGLGMATTSNATGPWSSSLLLKASPDAEYIVRYSGMYKPNGQTQMYFRWGTLEQYGDRVKLWIDNKLIIDQWSSLDSTTPSGTYLFDSSSGVYDFHTEYFRQAGANTTPVFQDDTTTGFGTDMPTGRLYFQDKVSGSPYAVTVSS